MCDFELSLVYYFKKSATYTFIDMIVEMKALKLARDVYISVVFSITSSGESWYTLISDKNTHTHIHGTH